ncbi:MAG: hypothetical protein JJE40_20420 [Vicinamibacteria bacterium]|nr:hypothetical protein [Vicinamibacteria bacterium]
MFNSKRALPFAILGIVAGLAGWAYTDYRSWLALGPGGVPYNLQGWAQVTWFRFQMRNSLDTSFIEAQIGRQGDSRGFDELTARPGQRPRVDPHPIPHRQLDQFGDKETRRAQQALFDTVTSGNHLLVYRKSVFERRNDAVCLREPITGNQTTAAQGEIAHIHPSDGSMHMTLSPTDAPRVIHAGWGELHGLAGVNGRLPATYTMVYSPRNEKEIAVVEQILHAAVKYAAGVQPK